MQIAIDIGNTFAKIGIFDENKMLRFYQQLSMQEVESIVAQYQPLYVIIADVSGKGAALSFPDSCGVLLLSHQTPIPLQNRYQTPQTLGMDRLAAAIGVWSRFPGQASLVIDAGTCITYDFIHEENAYCGGSISPGLQMRFRALHEFTARLPLLASTDEQVALTGTTTREAMLSGVINGMIYEIEGVISAYSAPYRAAGKPLEVVICGGDADYFEKRIKPRIFADQMILLTGLNQILQYNLQTGGLAN